MLATRGECGGPPGDSHSQHCLNCIYSGPVDTVSEITHVRQNVEIVRVVAPDTMRAVRLWKLILISGWHPIANVGHKQYAVEYQR